MPLHKRYKLLLDEGLPPCSSFPNLNNLHDLKHIALDFDFGGASDNRVYKLAEKESRIIVVFNIKHFLPLVKSKNMPSIISLSTNLRNKDIDLKLCKLLSSLKPSEAKGYLISLSNFGENKKSFTK